MRTIRSAASLALTAVLLAACTTTTPSAAPASMAPSASVAPSAAASACPIAAQEGRLLSDRLVDVALQAGGAGATLVFRFGARSTAPTNPTGHLTAVAPPFTMAGSGQAVEVAGDRFFQVRFEGMYLYDDSGAPTYAGSRRLTGGSGPIADAVVTDESEGYVTWIVGIRGGACVTLEAPSPTELRIAVAAG